MKPKIIKKFYEYCKVNKVTVNPFIEYYIFSNNFLKCMGLNPAQPKKKINVKVILNALTGFVKNISVFKNSSNELVILDDSSNSLENKFIKTDFKNPIFLTLNSSFPTNQKALNIFLMYRICDFLSSLSFFIFWKKTNKLILRSRFRMHFWKNFIPAFKNLKKIHLTDSYLKRELIYYCHKNQIEVVEHRHGLILPSHPGYYNFFRGIYTNLSPHCIISGNSKYIFKKNQNIDLQRLNCIKIPPKNDQQKYSFEQIIQRALDLDLTIILISQFSISKQVIETYKKIKKNKNKVVVKKHPVESEEKGINYINKIPKEKEKFIIIGWYSTLLLDLISNFYSVYIFKNPLNYFDVLLDNYYFLED